MLDPLFTPTRQRLPLFAPDEAGSDPPAAAGDTPPADPPAGDTPPANPPAAAGDTPPADPPGATRWWEDEKRFSKEQRQTLTKSGLTVEDPLDAVAKLADMEIAAQRRLGDGPENLIRKPKEGQTPAEWRREHAKDFGIPATGADYKIVRPEGWPNDMPWDDKLEAGARAVAEKHAADPALVQDIANLYAERVKETAEQVDGEIQRAQADMMAELERDWGNKLDGNMLRAQLAMKAAAEAAGLDQAAIDELVMVLEKKTGAANVMRLFAAIGDGMGEDTLTGAGGAPSLSNTPAAARAELAKLQAKGGEYYEAVNSNNRTEIARLQPRIDHLRKLASR